ncbi:MAG: toll/interleukin-1 receptor domain-containing protein [Chitinophagaceae bacterium]|nr:MAG: toll/interleukin-1 receptor domain-containing protein [Chitinophagaceae bacterium]
MADVFISYSSTDKTVVMRLAQLLTQRGYSVWWDRQIPIGEHYDNVIERELQQARCVVVVWTQRSVASEWVKNEAAAAASSKKLAPVMLENVELPLAFKRTEAAQLFNWDGNTGHPELEMLFDSIGKIIGDDGRSLAAAGVGSANTSKPIRNRWWLWLGLAGMTGSLLLYMLFQNQMSKGFAILLLLLFSLSIGCTVWSLVKLYTDKQHLQPSVFLKMASPAAALLSLLIGALLLSGRSTEKNITVRIFDWKKNPITQGDVKIYLPEYVRTQSIDNMGQALFTGIPEAALQSPMKIEVSSAGFAGKIFDTLLRNTRPLELTLPHTTVVFISGKIKTAAEMPIRGVEISADGTRYYAMSITDGSYNLRLEEYTLGDEISLTTSHKDYEDKTVMLRIQSPTIQNQDIFLNPITH